MRREPEASQQLARIAIQNPSAEDALPQAASIIRRATGAGEATIVYAQDQDLLVCSDPVDGAGANSTQIALWVVQRQIMEF